MILIVLLFRQSTQLLHLRRVTLKIFFLFTVTLSWLVNIMFIVFLLVILTRRVWNLHHMFSYFRTPKLHDYKKKSSSGIFEATLWWSSSFSWITLRLVSIMNVDSKIQGIFLSSFTRSTLMISLILGWKLELYHAVCLPPKENVWVERVEIFDSQHVQQTHRSSA